MGEIWLRASYDWQLAGLGICRGLCFDVGICDFYGAAIGQVKTVRE
jgi:hypothetical protein